MTGKEFRRASRRQLVELIYEMKKKELDLQARLDRALAELEDRNIRMEEAGSIAQAAVSLSGVFDAAQQAADLYLQSLKAAHGEREEILARAWEESAKIIMDAQAQAEAIRAGEAPESAE